jgi:hypothetical protein
MLDLEDQATAGETSAAVAVDLVDHGGTAHGTRHGSLDAVTLREDCAAWKNIGACK